MTKLFIAIYGILLLVGGYMGFAKAGSKISLVTGIISSVLVFFGVYLMGSNAELGYKVVAGVSGLLTIVFVMRFLKTQQFMPSGLLILASLTILILSIMALRQNV